MDLSVSPDLATYYCYAVVLAAGAITAALQISRRLGDIDGIWFVGRTWFLFFLYLIVPVLLFWFLDRTGAIADTSLFAAILIGFGYERIINGSSQTVRAPGDISQFWTPFVAYADKVAERALKESANRRARLAERIITSIVEDSQRYPALEALALRFSPDTTAFRQQLQAIDATAATRGASDILEEKTRYLYGTLVAIPDIHFLMKAKGSISPKIYWLDVHRLRPLARTTAIVTVAIVLIIAALVQLKPDYDDLRAAYYVWRTAKPNSTAIDQSRTRQGLFDLMATAPAAANATRRLTALLRRPALPMERIDLALRILLESRAEPGGNPHLPQLLVQSLRTESVDARTRINDVLTFLAGACGSAPSKDLADWKPTDGDSTVVLEQKVDSWSAYWLQPCAPKSGSST